MAGETKGCARLRAWLRDERRSQAWIAEQVGVHQTAVSRWLGGAVPPLESALELRRVTGIEVEDWAVLAEPSSTPSVAQ